jgi:hypothetical protein
VTMDFIHPKYDEFSSSLATHATMARAEGGGTNRYTRWPMHITPPNLVTNLFFMGPLHRATES